MQPLLRSITGPAVRVTGAVPTSSTPPQFMTVKPCSCHVLCTERQRLTWQNTPLSMSTVPNGACANMSTDNTGLNSDSISSKFCRIWQKMKVSAEPHVAEKMTKRPAALRCCGNHKQRAVILLPWHQTRTVLQFGETGPYLQRNAILSQLSPATPLAVSQRQLISSGRGSSTHVPELHTSAGRSAHASSFTTVKQEHCTVEQPLITSRVRARVCMCTCLCVCVCVCLCVCVLLFNNKPRGIFRTAKPRSYFFRQKTQSVCPFSSCFHVCERVSGHKSNPAIRRPVFCSLVSPTRPSLTS